MDLDKQVDEIRRRGDDVVNLRGEWIIFLQGAPVSGASWQDRGAAVAALEVERRRAQKGK